MKGKQKDLTKRNYLRYISSLQEITCFGLHLKLLSIFNNQHKQAGVLERTRGKQTHYLSGEFQRLCALVSKYHLLSTEVLK